MMGSRDQAFNAFAISKFLSRRVLCLLIPLLAFSGIIGTSLYGDYVPTLKQQAASVYNGWRFGSNSRTSSGSSSSSLQYPGSKGDPASGNDGYGEGFPGSSRPYARPGFEAPIAGGIPLRILPLGSSTTKGSLSSSDNGYREPLRTLLTSAGNPVNMVGTFRDGNMTDNDHESANGRRLDMMYRRIKENQLVRQSQPNVIVVMLGTNDCMQNYKMDTLYQRYSLLVDFLLEQSPSATLIMATLPVVRENVFWDWPGKRIPIANAQIRALAQILREEKGKRVVIAEQEGPLSLQAESLQWDLCHPNDAGYALVGSIIFNAILEADARGFLQPPTPVDGILDDGNAERSNGLFDRKKDWTSELRPAVQKDQLGMMRHGLASFYASIKGSENEAMPHDPPVPAFDIPGGDSPTPPPPEPEYGTLPPQEVKNEPQPRKEEPTSEPPPPPDQQSQKSE